jgi:hypothetical protein
MARRTEIEVFGLSMLDTVTCGLGGALILMLFIASKIEPQAAIAVSRESAAGATTATTGKDDGDAQRSAHGLASIVQSFQAADAGAEVVLKPCEGGTLPVGVRVASLRDTNAVFDGKPKSMGAAIWWQSADLTMAPRCISIEFRGIAAGPCSTVYVADAHAYRRRDDKCVLSGQIERAAADGIYEFRVRSEGP